MGMERDSAFTGLEAAIVLIAFVIVATVFSYLILGSGILATQRVQDTVHTGIASGGSTLYVAGDIRGVRTTLTSPASIRSILIPLRVIGCGEGFDVKTMSIRVISMSNKEELDLNQTYMNVYPRTGRWSIQQVLNGNGNTIIDDGEEFLINATLTNTGDMIPYQQFSIEIKPVEGTGLRITRTIPSALYPLTVLD
jgi:flagellin FlaB